MVRVRIVDGTESSRAACVTKDHGLLVAVDPSPPILEQRTIIFRQYMTVDGEPDGSHDMRVDGSGDPVLFYVKAAQAAYRYITSLSFIISDVNATLDKFGFLTALTNGCRLYYESAMGDIDIHDGLKSNFDFVRLAMGQPAFGTTGDSFRASNVVGNSEGYIPVVDFQKMLPPFGIRLDFGSVQRLVLAVQDDTQLVDGFDAIAFGFDRLV